MTDVAHSTLTGTDLHEPKGVAAATAGQVYVADGSGSGAWALPKLTKSFEGTATTLTVASGYSFTHSLGSTPKLVYPYLICQTADNGYAVGDEVSLTSFFSFTTFNNAYVGGPLGSVSCDTTAIRITIGSPSNSFYIINKSTAAFLSAGTFSSWKLNVRAWA